MHDSNAYGCSTSTNYMCALKIVVCQRPQYLG